MAADDTREAGLVRTIRFRAHHHYRRRGWTESENERVFGAQCRPHAHDWRLEVHVAGPVDPQTGWCVELEALDAAISAATAGWDGGDLNVAVPEVAAGELMPSTENLARWLFARLAAALAGGGRGGARLVQVRLFESEELGSAWPA